MAGVCSLCHPKTEEIVREAHYWRIIANQDQNLLGKCFIALNRHEEDLFHLRQPELDELWSLAAKVREALRELFQADHFNFAFLGNNDRHLHMHAVPRYRGTRFFAGLVFDDKAWGHHYDLIPRRVPPEVAAQLVAAMKEKLAPLLAKPEKRRAIGKSEKPKGRLKKAAKPKAKRSTKGPKKRRR
ncbi:HIT family protein [Candidatus Acetothermia bacterium]|nr:HIT family protein [Candidatus Acetothermia bacterium]